jgi:hypothetical protein
MRRATASGGFQGPFEIPGALATWLGVLLVFVGVLQMAFQPIWRGHGTKRLRAGRDTLEPEGPGSGFGIKSNWPGLVLVAFGGAFLLAAVAI